MIHNKIVKFGRFFFMFSEVAGILELGEMILNQIVKFGPFFFSCFLKFLKD